ncbi:Ig-like domain-containing protein [Archangium violaceum]|uniref:Ig-like domain-containing protein n=1 Tax=Archangium violaceum TaxID=83451 RepID=UPI002B2E3CF7|nr:Ig-like domain-containing protein [Archangium gephyra]
MRLITLLVVGLVFASARASAAGLTDTTPPSVEITAPPTGGAIGAAWRLTIIAEASDDSGVSQVEFFVEGVWVGTATSAPYQVTWDSMGAASGVYSLTAVATDLHGNTATSNPVLLTVDLEPPTVSFSSPTQGATLSGVIPFRVDTTDDVGIQWVDYYVDDKWLVSLSTPPFSLDWDSGAAADGPHTLRVEVRDALHYPPVTSTLTVNTLQPVSAEYDPTLRVPLCATISPFCDTTNRVRGHNHSEPNAPNALKPQCADGMLDYPNGQINRLKVSTVSGALLGTGERVRLDVHVDFRDAGYVVDLFTTSDVTQPSWTWLTTIQPEDWPRTQVLSAEYVLPTGKRQAVRAQLRVGYETLSPCSPTRDGDRDDVAFAVDSAPAVTLTAPAPNAQLKGVISLTAAVDFLHPVTKVEFYDGATLLGTRTSAPYTFSWNTAGMADGVHLLSAKAYDTAGRDGTSPAVAVTLDNNPPTVALISPTPGALLRERVELEVTASDTVSTYIPKIEFYDGTTLLGTASGGNTQWSWNTSTATDGPHTLTVKAYDHLGNVRTSTAVEVIVDNTRPTVTLTAPPQTINDFRGTLQLTATASDNLEVARVEFYRDSDTLLGTDTSAPYAMSWDSTSVADGYHSFFVRAYDITGNVGASGWSVVTIDNTLPSVTLTAPTQGALLRGTVTLQASASDNQVVKLLEFYDGATLLGTAFGGRTAIAWNTVGATQGIHTLTVKAYDDAGNARTSAGVEVSVDNTAPTTAVSAPAQNSWLRGTVQVSASASDNLGVTRVEFLAGTTLLGTDTTAPYSVSWDTTGGADGGVTLTTRAYDAAGNVTVSAGRPVTVDNAAPSVAITSPANGASLSVLFLSTTVQASASDNVGVTQVVFYDGATVLGTDTTAPYSVSWNLLTASKGTHTLTARVHDAAGNTTLSAPISVTVK